MSGQIIRHAITMLTSNLNDALRVSVVPFGLLAVLGYALFANVAGGALPEGDGSLSGGASVALLVVLFGLFVVTSWVPVLWHRFVLLEEYPSWLPALHLENVLGYMGRLILISLILVGVLLGGGFAIGVVSLIFGGAVTGIFVLLGSALQLVVIVLMYYLSLRFSLALTAVSINATVGIFESFRLSAPYSTTIFQVALMLGFINVVLSLIIGPVLVLGFGFSFIVEVLVYWAQFMLGLSVQTTLYGIIVERRRLS